MLTHHSTADFINVQSKHGLTGLHFASIGGHIAIIKELINNGASCATQSVTGSTPLHSAASNGHRDVCEFFFRDDRVTVDFDAVDEEGATPIEDALSTGYKELASRLAFWSYINSRTDSILCGACH
jgi:ankyrin repeat protein